MERYEMLKEIGAGNFGVACLMRHKETKELVAMKYIPRGLKQVVVTPTHLAICMEYAAGGELFDRICTAWRFSEDEARYFFQQLICGVSYCHFMQICHRDMKLENTLLVVPANQMYQFIRSPWPARSWTGTPAIVAATLNDCLLCLGY